jgi:protein TonB
MAQYTPPKIVKDEEVKEPPPPIEKVVVSKIGDVNKEGTVDQGIVAAPVVANPGPSIAVEKKPEEDYDKIFTVVQVPAAFPGGQAAWTKYLTRNLNADIPSQNGAPTGSYTVIVTFIVDKQGVISDVSAENDPGYGTKDEAIRVIKRGPNWTPAIQNGRNVIARHRQSITFQVADEY